MPFDPAEFERFIQSDLTRRATQHLLRTRRIVRHDSPTAAVIDAVTYVDFASNNYLGLTHHPTVINAVRRTARETGVGSGAAPLITGHSPHHAIAERTIADWKGAEDAVLLPSGYQANHAVVQTLIALGERREGQGAPGGGVRFLIDKLAHASLLDAVRGAAAEFRVFPHNGLTKLRRLLAYAPPDQLQVVLTESIFSMDGDAADLRSLVALRREHPFLLVLDEAHGSGVYGRDGAGYAAELGLAADVDVSVVTMSKAMGSAGGAVCASKAFCEAVVNYGRAFVYSTAVPAPTAAAATAAIAVMRLEPQRQARVRELAQRFRNSVARLAVEVPPGDSPIVPIIIGDEARALHVSARLADARLLVPAVRPPTVPKGGSRLRVTLCAEHTDDEVARLVDALSGVLGLRG
jgi:8-amino-7-oxononanoate synthase